MVLLVPSDVLSPRRVDDHFAAEASAAGVAVALVDHDALVAGEADRAVARVNAGQGTAVYRGWMLSATAYRGFADALSRAGITLRTSADDYRRGHELPGWYDALAAFTPETRWTDGGEREAFEAARTALGDGPAVLRDYTKSMKHHWDEAAFIPDLGNADGAWKVARRMRELRDDDFAGGFVLRRFEEFAGAEVRTWWVGGACRMITAHPDTPDETPALEMPAGLPDAVAGLALPFVTVDLARRADGAWRVVELGDGQVSDRPVTTPAAAFVAAILG